MIDGDTAVFRVNNTEETVRFLGVDAPETKHPNLEIECYGPEAAAFTKSMLLDGTSVMLELDEEIRDKYGRLLAYIHLPDGRILNELLIRQGYGTMQTIQPNDYYEPLFVAAQNAAQANERGLWSACHK